jgi:hypothetical protein
VPRTTGYCDIDDLLLGEMPLSSGLSRQKFINDSADEIDVRIGRIYDTPIQIANLENTSKLTLKLANARLASGRILMAQAQAAQDDSLHAYGMYLIREAENVIVSIESNRLPLDGATVRDDLIDTPAPTIRNQDSHSPVDAFYGEFFGPVSPLPTSPIWRPGSH